MVKRLHGLMIIAHRMTISELRIDATPSRR
jgi:hypothetical protein